MTAVDEPNKSANLSGKTSGEHKINIVPLSRNTVLYIEDNHDNMKLMEHIFESLFEGVRLVTAKNAEDGIDLIRANHLDLVLMDIDLPGMNGFEALKMLQSDESTSKLPVIAVSAHATKDQINKGLQAGFIEYVTKPLDLPELKKTITHYLPTTH